MLYSLAWQTNKLQMYTNICTIARVSFANCKTLFYYNNTQLMILCCKALVSNVNEVYLISGLGLFSCFDSADASYRLTYILQSTVPLFARLKLPKISPRSFFLGGTYYLYLNTGQTKLEIRKFKNFQ